MPGRIERTSGVRESPVCIFRERAVPWHEHSDTEDEGDPETPTREFEGTPGFQPDLSRADDVRSPFHREDSNRNLRCKAPLKTLGAG